MQCPVEVNQTKLHMIRSDMLNYLWNPVSIFQEGTIGAGDSKLEKTITLSKVKVKLSFQKQICIHTINLFQDGKINAIYTSQDKYYEGLYEGISMKFDFTWYPFDTQKIILPIMTGK